MNIRGPRATISRMLTARTISSRRPSTLSNRFLKASSSRSKSSNINSPISKTGSISQTRQIVKYMDIENAAKKLQGDSKTIFDSAEKLTKLSEEKTKLATSGTDEEKKKNQTSIDDNNKEIKKAANDIVTQYNNMFEKVDELGGSTNISYYRRLKAIASNYHKELEEIGINMTNNGTLLIDTKKFDEASTEKINKIFATKGGFTTQLNEVAAALQKHANNMVSSLDRSYGTSTYNKYAQTSAYYGNNYNSSFNLFS